MKTFKGDLVLKKDGNLFLVQCKQWRSYKVDVRVVREMYGVMTAKQANGVIIITSGLFTQEAKSFATDKPIDLVEGNQEETWRGIIFGQYWAYDHTFHFQISSWLSTQGKPEDLLNDFSELYPNYLPIQNHG